MKLTTRGLADVLSTSNLDSLCRELKQLKDQYNIKVPPTPEQPSTTLPIRGECSIATWPVYIVPPTKKKPERNPLLRMLPTLNAGDEYLTPSPDFAGWERIQDLPPKARQAGALGPYTIYVDRAFPNANGAIQNPVQLYALLADFVNRCGARDPDFPLMPLNGSAVVEDATPIAVTSRLEAALEYNIQTNSWSSIVDEGTTPSALRNFSQSKKLTVMYQEGSYSLTGKQIADIALSTESALTQLGQVYQDNIGIFLRGTRFMFLHPTDTVGYFSRHVKNESTRSFPPLVAPRKHRYPIFFLNTEKQRWYEVSKEFSILATDEVPDNIIKAGTLSNIYDVYYEDSTDSYTSQQLGWLVKVIMDSPVITPTEGVLLMRGCMQYLNCSLASLFAEGTVESLMSAENTRFPNLDPDPARAKPFAAIWSFLNQAVTPYLYQSDDGTCTPTPYYEVPCTVFANCTEGRTTATTVAKALVRLSESDFLKDANDAISKQTGLLLNDPLPEILNWYCQPVHIIDEPALMSPILIYLQTADGATYMADGKYGWAPSQLDPDAPYIGEFFGHKLYADSSDEFMITPDELTSILLGTLHYFVNFTDYKSLFTWLYSADVNGPWYDSPNSTISGVMILRPESGQELIYDFKRNYWSQSNPVDQLTPVVKAAKFRVGFTVNDKLTTTHLVNAIESLQKFLPYMHHFKESPAIDLLPRFESPRPTSAVTTKEGVISYNGHTYDDTAGCWAHYTEARNGFTDRESVISREDFSYALIDWVCIFANFANAPEAFSYFEGALGNALTDIPPVQPPRIYMNITNDSYFVYDNGSWTLNPNTGVPNLPKVCTFDGISIMVHAPSGYILVKDLIDAMSFDSMVEHMRHTISRTISYRQNELKELMDAYTRQTEGLYYNLLHSINKKFLNTVPYLCISCHGTLYGYDGKNWGVCKLPISPVEVGKFGNSTIYKVPGYEDKIMFATDAADCLAIALELFLDTALDDFPNRAISTSVWRKQHGA